MKITPILFAALVVIGNAFASVVPVPSTVIPERIPGAKPRNVVFILSDDHRFDAMGFMGHPLAVTPQMDRLAAEGVHLKNALVTTSLCSPSRASILTGLYTFRHRVIDNQREIPAGTLYFPQYLQAAGYSTAFIGKWHMGSEGDAPQPGFDHWVSFRAVHANFTPEPTYEDSLADRPYTRPETEADTDENYANKPRWLRDQRNSWHGVDFPYHSALDIEKYYKRYCEALRSVDDSIGRVMTQLESMGMADDTLVIYMGDNGFMFGEHGLIDKRVAYETSIRVPMLMRCPALFKGHTVVEEVVANIDIAPTVMAAMGLAKPAHMDGLDFAPLAQGKQIKWRDYFLYVYYWEKNFPQSPTVFAIRGDRYKYINYYGIWDADELYDLQNDPDETTNLLYTEGYEKIRRDLETRLYAMMDDLGGMELPLNAPKGNSQNKRLGPRGGHQASDFPAPLVVEEPINHNAN